jgi:membrane protein
VTLPDPPPSNAPGTRERVRRTRERFEASTAGRLQRRIVEVQLTKQALILAALALMLVIPALVTLAAVLPLGTENGSFGGFVLRLGLTPEATRDLQQLFPSRSTVRSASTWIGATLTVILTVRWPMALQRAYEIVWGLPFGGLRSLGRPLLWLVAAIAVVGLAAFVDPLLSGVVWLVALLALGTPLAVGWAWWTQYLLLGGRIGWRPLLPGAVVIGIGLVGLRIGADIVLSPSISLHYREYGPLGIVFVMLSWFVAFSVVLLGGAVVGHLLVVSRTLTPAASDPDGSDPDAPPPSPSAPAAPAPAGSPPSGSSPGPGPAR